MNGCTIPYTPIAVDLWKTRQCSRVRLFFLSHVHLDQSCGLSSSWSSPIYCSPISKKLLLKQFQMEESVVHELDLNTPHVIPLTACGDVKITVTLIDANHCPGSVMFLFVGYFGCILYTGDFRYDESLLSCGPLADLASSAIDTLYIDNTFCSPKCVFPPRTETLQDIINIIEQHPVERVVFGLRSLGKEELLIHIAEKFNEKILVSAERFSVLEMLGMQDKFVVTGTEENMVKPRFEVVPLVEVTRTNVDTWNRSSPTIAILPTALFTGLGFQPFTGSTDIFVVPYSDHSPFAELREFVARVRPKSVVPIIRTDPGSRDDPLAASLLDRTNVECFAECLDRTPMQNYHIPTAVLELMNKGPETGPRNSRRRTVSTRRPSTHTSQTNSSRSTSFSSTNNTPTQPHVLSSSEQSVSNGSKVTSTVPKPHVPVPKQHVAALKAHAAMSLKPHVAVRPMKRCSSSDKLLALAMRPPSHLVKHKLLRGSIPLLPVATTGAVRHNSIAHHMISVLRLKNKDKSTPSTAFRQQRYRLPVSSEAILNSAPTTESVQQHLLELNRGEETRYIYQSSPDLVLVASNNAGSADNLAQISSMGSSLMTADAATCYQCTPAAAAAAAVTSSSDMTVVSSSEVAVLCPSADMFLLTDAAINLCNPPQHDVHGALNLSQTPTAPALVLYHVPDVVDVIAPSTMSYLPSQQRSDQLCSTPSVSTSPVYASLPPDNYLTLPLAGLPLDNHVTSTDERHAISGLLGLSQTVDNSMFYTVSESFSSCNMAIGTTVVLTTGQNINPTTTTSVLVGNTMSSIEQYSQLTESYDSQHRQQTIGTEAGPQTMHEETESCYREIDVQRGRVYRDEPLLPHWIVSTSDGNTQSTTVTSSSVVTTTTEQQHQLLNGSRSTSVLETLCVDGPELNNVPATPGIAEYVQAAMTAIVPECIQSITGAIPENISCTAAAASGSEHNIHPKKKWRRRFRSSQQHRAHQENKIIVPTVGIPGVGGACGGPVKCGSVDCNDKVTSVSSVGSCGSKRSPLVTSHRLHYETLSTATPVITDFTSTSLLGPHHRHTTCCTTSVWSSRRTDNRSPYGNVLSERRAKKGVQNYTMSAPVPPSTVTITTSSVSAATTTAAAAAAAAGLSHCSQSSQVSLHSVTNVEQLHSVPLDLSVNRPPSPGGAVTHRNTVSWPSSPGGAVTHRNTVSWPSSPGDAVTHRNTVSWSSPGGAVVNCVDCSDLTSATNDAISA